MQVYFAQLQKWLVRARDRPQFTREMTQFAQNILGIIFVQFEHHTRHPVI